MEHIYRENFDLVFYIVKQFGLRDEETEEIVQEAFVRVFENRHRLEPDKIRAFLVTTARNLTIDGLRKKKRQKVVYIEDQESSVNTNEDIWKNDPRRILEAQAVSEFLAEIKDKPGSDVLIMYYQEGLTTKEIADRLNEGVNTVTSRLSRARNKFREHLQKILDKNWQMED